MATWQWRQRPRCSSQLSSGRFSNQLREAPQRGQWLPGNSSDSCRGSRQTTTLRKLPMQAPARATKKASRGGGSAEDRRGLGSWQRAAGPPPGAATPGRSGTQQVHRHELLIRQEDRGLKHHPPLGAGAEKNDTQRLRGGGTGFQKTEIHPSRVSQQLGAVDAIKAQGSLGRGRRGLPAADLKGGTAGSGRGDGGGLGGDGIHRFLSGDLRAERKIKRLIFS